MLLTALPGIASDRPAAFAAKRPSVLFGGTQPDAVQRITTTNSPGYAASKTRITVRVTRWGFPEFLRAAEPFPTVGIASNVGTT